ncbi:MAG: Na+/H+ antiporter NhaA [Acidobacteria bacterium]|nr:Na+/H+ antiporter NhaA [Acidobacteriota bacterium]
MTARKRIRTVGSLIFERFVRSEVSASGLLLASTAAALVLANSPWAETYRALADARIGPSWGDRALSLSVQAWINDLLMAVFFFVVGLEIKREFVAGQLSSRRKATLPLVAAFGGMVVPAVLYAALNGGGPGARGWGIPMATDIAFALGVLAAFGRRVPVGLKVFLTALAISDDLGAVLVIAVFYTSQLHWAALLVAGVLLALIAAASRAGVRFASVYLLIAMGVWAAVFASGIHATVAGVLVAMMLPVRDRHDGLMPAGLTLEDRLHPPVAFVILPLFAFFNAGVTIDGRVMAGLAYPVSLGIIVGLVIGKQIGILLFSWIAVKSGQAVLPDGLGWVDLYGAACVAGIGFTMSLFVAELAFGGTAGTLSQAKAGILCASLVAAAWGSAVLHARFKR